MNSFRQFLRSRMKKELGKAKGYTKRWCRRHTLSDKKFIRPTLHNMVMLHLGLHGEVRYLSTLGVVSRDS